MTDFWVTNDTPHVFGARTSFQNKAFCLLFVSNNAGCVQIGNSIFNGGTFESTIRHTVTMTSSELNIDGAVSASYSVSEFSCEVNAYLMSIPGVSSPNTAVGKLYSCQIYDNGTLIRDYVPAKNSGEVVGLYDLVNDTFYQNAGTGVFAAGPEVISDPESSQNLDPYTWYEEDIPTNSRMNGYIYNINALRNSIPLLNTTPNAPSSMVGFNYIEANAIEQILSDAEVVINSFIKVFQRAEIPWMVANGPIFYFSN